MILKGKKKNRKENKNLSFKKDVSDYNVSSLHRAQWEVKHFSEHSLRRTHFYFFRSWDCVKVKDTTGKSWLGGSKRKKKVNGWKRIVGCGCGVGERKMRDPKEETRKGDYSEKASPCPGWFLPGNFRPTTQRGQRNKPQAAWNSSCKVARSLGWLLFTNWSPPWKWLYQVSCTP